MPFSVYIRARRIASTRRAFNLPAARPALRAAASSATAMALPSRAALGSQWCAMVTVLVDEADLAPLLLDTLVRASRKC
jgi:hypothetical protein